MEARGNHGGLPGGGKLQEHTSLPLDVKESVDHPCGWALMNSECPSEWEIG